MMSPVLRSTMWGRTRVNRAEDRVDVEIEHSIPRVGIALDNLAADIGARIGVENVELSGLFEDRGRHALDARRIQKVGDDRNSVLAEFRAQRLQLILGHVDQRHARARLEHGARARQADAGRSARDRGHLAGKTISHFNLLVSAAQARPWETRERRARESTMTATASTQPVIMYRSDDDRSSSVRPLAMDWMTMMPSSAE